MSDATWTRPEAITDAAELAQVRRQARKVHVKSLGLTNSARGVGPDDSNLEVKL